MESKTMKELYRPDTAKQWQEDETMKHASGVFGRYEMFRKLKELIKPSDTVVDLGCGGGYPTAKMAELAKDGKVIGVEFSKSMLGFKEGSMPISKKYEKLQNLIFVNANGQKLPIESECSDLVTSFMFLHNLELDEIKKVFFETARVLKPGGKSIHLTMHPDLFNSEWDLDFMRYKKEQLEKFKSTEEKEGMWLDADVKNAGGGGKPVGMYYHTKENIELAAKEAGLEIKQEKPLYIDEKTAKEKFGENSVGKIPENPAFWIITLEKMNNM